MQNWNNEQKPHPGNTAAVNKVMHCSNPRVGGPESSFLLKLLKLLILLAVMNLFSDVNRRGHSSPPQGAGKAVLLLFSKLLIMFRDAFLLLSAKTVINCR